MRFGRAAFLHTPPLRGMRGTPMRAASGSRRKPASQNQSASKTSRDAGTQIRAPTHGQAKTEAAKLRDGIRPMLSCNGLLGLCRS
jgi:hypothetical protein